MHLNTVTIKNSLRNKTNLFLVVTVKLIVNLKSIERKKTEKNYLSFHGSDKTIIVLINHFVHPFRKCSDTERSSEQCHKRSS